MEIAEMERKEREKVCPELGRFTSDLKSFVEGSAVKALRLKIEENEGLIRKY